MNDEVQERRDIILGSTKGALSDTATGANPSNSAALETVVEVRTAAGSEALVSAAERPKATGSESMKESCIAVDAKYEGGGSKTGNWDGEKMCRICYLSSDRRSDGSDLMQLGCGCKDELGIAHRHCAETWFKLKGNRKAGGCSIKSQPSPHFSLYHMSSHDKVGEVGMAAVDKYRSFIHGDGEKETQWRHGGPPTYDIVNKLFEEGRTKEWPEGSLEEIVQNAIKTWEMEVSHKQRVQDVKSINPEKFKFIVNGRQELSGEELLKLGTYNALLQNSLPEEFQYYKAKDESFESSHEVFRTCFPRGFAWEVLEVYSGPPVIAFKYRHWGFMEGPFKGHAPTGDKVEFSGLAVLKVDDSLRAEEVEIYYDPGELFGGLLKGPLTTFHPSEVGSSLQACPFFKGD